MLKPSWLPLLVLCFPLFANASDCQNLEEELDALRQAQQTIMTSLANNHETFATSLEEVTDELALRSSRVPPKAIQSMNKTAQAFRARGLKAKSQAAKLDLASSDLFARVSICVNQ